MSEDVDDSLRDYALKLYDKGFNIVAVGPDKKPLSKWSSKKRISRDKLKKLIDAASGIAIVGGSENPWKHVATLVIIDIDDPRLLDEHSYLKSIIYSTVSWKTGPRCPKCFSKHVDVIEYGRRFRCSNCKHEFTLEEALRGFAALITVDPSTSDRYFKNTIRKGGIEFLVNNYALIPPSVHPTGVKYEWVKPFDFNSPNLGVRSLSEIEVEKLLEELGFTVRETERVESVRGSREFRELNDKEKIEIVDLLKNAYRPGYRQMIWLYLSGWAAKARVSPISIAEVLKKLYDETNDEDPIKMRASALIYSYKKAGYELDEYADKIERILGIKPYGLEREFNEENIKGVSGLQEILEKVLEEKKALQVIEKISDIFKTASPYKDSVFRILDHERQLYAIANLRKRFVVRARKQNDEFIYKEHVFIGAPTHVEVIENPITKGVKYRLIWEIPSGDTPIIIEGSPPEIIEELRAKGLVLNRFLAEDVLNAILDAYRLSGRAVIKREIEARGFFIMENKLVAVNVEVKQPDTKDLREALLLLNELADKWYNHVLDKFARQIRWGIISPFIYAYKQLDRWIRYRYLHGVSGSGKTTLGKIVLYMWGLGPDHEKAGSQVDTVARLGEVISRTTFPIVINEPGALFEKEDTREMLKSSIESPVARGKFFGRYYRDIPSCSPIIFTSNKYLPRDDALLRRLEVETFTYGDKISKDKVKDFEKNVMPRLYKLKALGDFAAFYVLNKGILDDLEELATKILEEAYREAGLEIPQWIYARYVEEKDFYEDMRESIRIFLMNKINEAYNRFVGRITVETSEGYSFRERSDLGLEDRVKIVLEKELIPWLFTSKGFVYLTTGFYEELINVIGDVGGLKSVAEILGWNYKPRHSKREGEKVTSLSVIEVFLRDFIEFLKPPV